MNRFSWTTRRRNREEHAHTTRWQTHQRSESLKFDSAQSVQTTIISNTMKLRAANLGFLLLFTVVTQAFLVEPFPIRRRSIDFLRLSASASSAAGNSRLQPSASSIAGVSVSPNGFWVFVKANFEKELPNSTLLLRPLQITNSSADDTAAATSPAALTLLQLLAGVDMAGAVFPPETLARMTQEQAKGEQAKLLNVILRATDDDGSSICILECAISNRERFSIVLNDNQDDDDNYEHFVPAAIGNDGITLSGAFLAVALALRYKVPLQVDDTSSTDDNASRTIPLLEEDSILDSFPAYQTTATAVWKPALASAAQLEQGLEIHTLHAALRVARDKGDAAAAAKIRAKIDAWDEQSFARIPVQPESDTSSMQ